MGSPDSDVRSIRTDYFGAVERPMIGAGRLMLRLACALAAVLAVVAPGVAFASPLPAVGGSQLSGHGVIVNGPSVALPHVKAAAWVIADAGTGQVLAARNPHGWYRPASTLKMLTAISLIPLLNPDGTVVATKLAASQTPNVVGLLPGHAYQISDLFTAL